MVDDDIFPRPGERVLVPWGLEEVLGEVIEVFPTGLGDRALVRIIESSDPDATVTVPADSLTPVGGLTHGMSPRIDHLTFANQVKNAISRTANEMGLSRLSQSRLDRGADAILTTGARQVAIQIKEFARGPLSSDTIAVLAGYAIPRRPVIMIANTGLTASADERLRRINRPRQMVWFVRWTGESDYGRLESAIRQALRLT